MIVNLVQVDGKLPNLALMKLSAWHKSRGDGVRLNSMGRADRTYVSSVFSWSEAKRRRWTALYPDAITGGSGFDPAVRLPEEIQWMKPDFDLFPEYPACVVYSYERCPRKCGFCVVPGQNIPEYHSSVRRLWDGKRRIMEFLDNNPMADPEWPKTVRELQELDLSSRWHGLDIRLVSETNALLLAGLRIDGYLHFAFDHVGMAKLVGRNVDLLCGAGIGKRRLMFYVLTNYDSTFEEDVERVEILRLLGVLPYVMVYEKGQAPARARAFQRWVNRRYYNFIPWGEYRHGRWPETERREGEQLSMYVQEPAV
ncbi:MAG: hypothetical protein HYT87_14735 [Nitrospirae bacterium]|nr:hypothetical protein [Nitrospirota bacterium]